MIDALLDTNILIDLIKELPVESQWAAENQGRHFGITPIVWMEVVQGAMNKRQRAVIMDFLKAFRVEHPTPDDNRWGNASSCPLQIKPQC